MLENITDVYLRPPLGNEHLKLDASSAHQSILLNGTILCLAVVCAFDINFSYSHFSFNFHGTYYLHVTVFCLLHVLQFWVIWFYWWKDDLVGKHINITGLIIYWPTTCTYQNFYCGTNFLMWVLAWTHVLYNCTCLGQTQATVDAFEGGKHSETINLLFCAIFIHVYTPNMSLTYGLEQFQNYNGQVRSAHNVC